jgi:NADPH:quinone reductase-like Zn-dependent oxidoreductase
MRMRRIRYEHSAQGDGGREVRFLIDDDVPVPEPGPGELLVRVEAIGVTLPVVRKVREQREPIPLGGEVAGEVTAVGPDVTGYAVGDRVTGLVFGHGYADFALLHTSMASPVPDGASAVTAVALVRSGLVAHGALRAARAVRGERALITAAASGVGHLALQLARAEGAASVTAAVSDAGKAGFLKGLGADEVVTYDAGSWGEPVDYVLDAVGGPVLKPAVTALGPGGRLVAYSSGGGTVDAFDLLTGSRTVTGFQLGRIAREQPDLYAAWRDHLWTLHATGRLTPAIHDTFPLPEAERAHEVIETRSNLGKVVLVP